MPEPDVPHAPGVAGMPVRRVPHRPPPIVAATDLGGVAVLKAGRQFLLSDASGDVPVDTRGLGLYDGDTRVLSCLLLRVDGARPSLLQTDGGASAEGTIHLTNPEVRRDAAEADTVANTLAGRSLALVRHHRIAGGLHERLAIANHTGAARTVIVELALDADMADIFEVQGHLRPERGEHLPIDIDGDRAVFAYKGLDGYTRRTRLTAPGARLAAAGPGDDGALVARWEPTIGAGGQATLDWSVEAEVPGPADGATRVAPAAVTAPPEEAMVVRSDDVLFDRVIARALADLALLVTPGPAAGERYLAAGIPWFATLFGRDAILASYAAAVVDPSLAVDTLRVLARLQAQADDPARDAEPGKIVHEIRDGEMARLGEVPFGRYYGASDTTPLWLVLLGEVFDWTGDVALASELWPTALAALGWLDRHADLDGDGFVEYRRRSEHGLVNHGWKDALDAVRDRQGALATGAIALVEVQGYAFDARVRMARLARVLGETDLADRLDAAAARLRARFAEAFWVADLGSYAMALDGAGRPMDAVASNQGHALWSGIVADGHARAVADRLRDPRLDSGWGIRTFAGGQPGYSPLGYHTGSVWPHDTAIAIAGLRRYGLAEDAAHFADELFAAARAMPEGRLPELFCGFGADEAEAPVPYPLACSPQAWAAGAPLLALRALLGIRPRAGEGVLELDHPRLPAGVDRLVLAGLRVGPARLDLHLRRSGDSTAVEVHRISGTIKVVVNA